MTSFEIHPIRKNITNLVVSFLLLFTGSSLADLVNVSNGTGVGSIQGTHGAGDSTLIVSSLQNGGGNIQSGPGLAFQQVENYIEASARAVQVLSFYNNSIYDSFDPAASSADDAAIATNKSFIQPGVTPDFSNYTSYSKGINGVMLDIVNLRATPDTADFSFKTGNNNDLSTWTMAPTPLSVSVRENEGLDGSDRVTIIWQDSEITSTWLQMRLMAGAEAGFLIDDWYFIGNAPGDTGDDSLAHVNAVDLLRIRANPISIFDPVATVENRYDINRDGYVNAQDFLITRSNPTSLLDASALILEAFTLPE